MVTFVSSVRTLLIYVRGKVLGKRMSRTIGMRFKRGNQPFGIMPMVIDVMMMDMTMITVVVLDTVVIV